jgi:hypothetical protein
MSNFVFDFFVVIGLSFFLAVYEKQGTMTKGGGAVRNPKAGKQTPNQAKNKEAVAAYKASGSPTFVPNQRELTAAWIEEKRAEQAARAVVPDTMPEQEPIDKDPSPVLAESTLAPAPTTPPATPLPATPLPATPLPTTPTIPAPRRTGTDVGIVVAIIVSCVALGVCVVWYNASKQSSQKRRRFS